MSEKLRLSASRIGVYRRCSWLYHLTYNENLIRKEVDMPLKVGGFVHALMERKHRGTLQEVLNDPEALAKELYPTSWDDALDVAIESLRLFHGYQKKYEDDTFTVVSSETHLELDMGPYILYSRLDSLKRGGDGRLWRGEYKTAGRMDSSYLQGLRGSIQSGMAHLLLKETVPEKVYGTLYEILVKTKVPQYERSLVLTETSLEKMTLDCVNGVWKDIDGGRFYRSMDCYTFNRECSHRLICLRDTPQNREEFYKERTDPLMDRKNEEGGEDL
jgi:hypothetical protein